MITENIIKFGYGDIVIIGSTKRISFQQTKTTGNCGGVVPENIEYTGKKIILDITYEDYCELCKNLKAVKNKEISKFTFKDYIFDFENYNEESINVFKTHLCIAASNYLMAIVA